MAKFCGNCGKELKEGQSICLNCGVQTGEPVKNRTDQFALVGFILGLVSIVTWLIPLFGLGTGICGIVFSVKGLKSIVNKTKAQVGLILSIIFLAITVVWSSCVTCINIANFYDTVNDTYDRYDYDYDYYY